MEHSQVGPWIFPLLHYTRIPGYCRVDPAFLWWCKRLPFNPSATRVKLPGQPTQVIFPGVLTPESGPAINWVDAAV